MTSALVNLTCNTFFTADTHWMHSNILKFCNRPYKDVEEMNVALIANWNKVVPVDAEVYHVGDFVFKGTWEDVRDIRKQLNGDITLILGNHDEAALECEKRIPGTFKEVTYCKDLKFGKQNIVLFHYGLRTWHHDLRGSWHLYGHSHGGLEPYGKSFDVGVDCVGTNYAPLSYERIESRMKYRPIGNHPKFGPTIGPDGDTA